MKTITLTLVALIVSGCSFILPIDHDGQMFGSLVSTKISVDVLTCEPKDQSKWEEAKRNAYYLSTYAKLRNDPQAENAEGLVEGLTKAQESKNLKFCESALRLSQSRVQVISNAWSGR
jgi:hypothetical protein